MEEQAKSFKKSREWHHNLASSESQESEMYGYVNMIWKIHL